MTRWGVILLILFLVLGLSRTKSSKATTLAVCMTAIILTVTMATYLR